MDNKHEACRNRGEAYDHPWQAVRFNGFVFLEMVVETKSPERGQKNERSDTNC